VNVVPSAQRSAVMKFALIHATKPVLKAETKAVAHDQTVAISAMSLV
jgi:hypothetical protein